MRDLRNTAPYMHNGSLKDLSEVVEFYNERSSVAPLRLTDAEVDRPRGLPRVALAIASGLVDPSGG